MLLLLINIYYNINIIKINNIMNGNLFFLIKTRYVFFNKMINRLIN